MFKKLLLLAFAVSGALWAQPVISPGSAVNAADYSRRIAPGSYIVFFGQGLAPQLQLASTVPLPTSILGTSVEVTDGSTTELLALWYVAPGQVAGQLSYEMQSPLQVRVVTGDGASVWDSFPLVARAPALYSTSQQGDGRAVMQHANGDFVERLKPLKPGQWAVLYANSLGAVDPLIPAGAAAGDGTSGNPWNLVTEPVEVTIDGRNTDVTYQGLAPYFAGLYQLNLFTPYYDLIGDLAIRVRVGGQESMAQMSVPVEPNGFYLLIGAGKFPNGQTKNGIPGPSSALAFRHEVPEIWGADGDRQWTHQSHLGAEHAATSGLALTLKNQGQVVYDNNGIDDGSFGSHYNNTVNPVPDGEKAGLWEWYSMSNDLYAMFAGYFKLNQTTAVDQIIGYFDGNGNAELPFDPENCYNTFRVNIFSDSAGFPASNSFVGDVFSSDSATVTSEFSETDAQRVFADGFSDRIYRMVYTLETPITLPAGEYWFSHDTAVPQDGGGIQQLSLKTKATSRAHKPIPPAKTFVLK